MMVTRSSRRTTLCAGITVLAARLAGVASVAASRSSSSSSSSSSLGPAKVGDNLSAVDTPALLLDLDAFEANCGALKARLAAARGANDVLARPHAKALKCAPLVARTLELLGPDHARGCCAQTVTELEALLIGGVRDVLLTNQIVGASKIARFARLVAEHADADGAELKVGVLVDSAENAVALSEALSAAGAPPVAAYIEVDVGQGRCGLDDPEAAAELAELLAERLARKGLFFGGLHAYHGANQHTGGSKAAGAGSERAAIFDATVMPMVEATLASLRKRGLSPAVITGGGTGSFELEAASGVYTEVQPGSFVVMDGQVTSQREGTRGRRFSHHAYLRAPTSLLTTPRNAHEPYHQNLLPLQCPANDQYEAAGMSGESGFAKALSVLTTVCSRPTPNRAVVDCGAKGIDLVAGMPDHRDEPNGNAIDGVLGYRLGGDEVGLGRGLPAP